MIVRRGAVHEVIVHAITAGGFVDLGRKTITLRGEQLPAVADRIIDDLAALALEAKVKRDEQSREQSNVER